MTDAARTAQGLIAMLDRSVTTTNPDDATHRRQTIVNRQIRRSAVAVALAVFANRLEDGGASPVHVQLARDWAMEIAKA